jgi:hypothetical protein
MDIDIMFLDASKFSMIVQIICWAMTINTAVTFLMFTFLIQKSQIRLSKTSMPKDDALPIAEDKRGIPLF